MQYILQQGVYDPDTNTITVSGGYRCTEDRTPIAGTEFSLPQDVVLTINADGSVTSNWFWTGFSWNREEGYIEF